MSEAWPADYDKDAYEPIYARVIAGSDKLIQIGVKRRPQYEIDRRRARREQRDKRDA